MAKRGGSKVAAAAKSEVPTLADVLDTMAYHVGNMMTARPGETVADLTEISFGCGLGGYGEGCPTVILQGTIRSAGGADAWGPWAQVTLNGKALGNRHGGQKEIARAYAPVVAWVAAYHAKREAAALVASVDGPTIAKAAS